MKASNSEYLKRGNLLWESSRMFLPEHREQLLEQRRRKQAYIAPELDEAHSQELDTALMAAYANGCPVVITFAGEYEPERIRGRVTRLDPYTDELRVETTDGIKKLRFRTILQLERDAYEDPSC